MLVVQLQNDLARLEVDVLHTQGHNVRLEQAMRLLNDEIDEKMQTIGKYEVRPLELTQSMDSLPACLLACVVYWLLEYF